VEPLALNGQRERSGVGEAAPPQRRRRRHLLPAAAEKRTPALNATFASTRPQILSSLAAGTCSAGLASTPGCGGGRTNAPSARRTQQSATSFQFTGEEQRSIPETRRKQATLVQGAFPRGLGQNGQSLSPRVDRAPVSG
ncbi:hypothetical protein TGDOM2_399730, partial [Toxoplasma gondii GAB2-2007-GAL-DOM2]